jgi:2'-5' RNA ligase
MPRLFTAIEIPSDIRGRLSMLRAGLRGARWVDPDNYHMTLRFAGDIDNRTAREFAQALAQVRASAFELRFTGLGSFGDRKPRSIWAGVETCEALLALQRAHERAARSAGLPPEARNFKPHVTLARMNGAQAHDVARYLEMQGGPIMAGFLVRRFVLYSSRASSGGGPSVVEEAFPLMGGGAEDEEE